MQQQLYSFERDYREGSPHLQHHDLHDRLVGLLHRELNDLADRGKAKTVLEIGAGHGGFSDYTLAFGFGVTATEMAAGSVQFLEQRYRSNDAFTVIHDPDGTLEGIRGRRFSAIMVISVLHHIPDYVAFLENVVREHLEEGGSLICMQDPLWYPTVAPFTLWLGRMGYLVWRLGKGGYAKGLRTRLRRMRGELDLSDPDDNVEYHIVRNGVDQRAIVERLGPSFGAVRLVPYWSTQAGVVQRVGDRLGMHNTFGIVARDYRP